MTAGANPVGIKKGIDKTCAFLVQKLEENAKPIRGTDDIRAVASISAGNDDEIGAMIAGAIEKVRAPAGGRLQRARVRAVPVGRLPQRLEAALQICGSKQLPAGGLGGWLLQVRLSKPLLD